MILLTRFVPRRAVSIAHATPALVPQSDNVHQQSEKQVLETRAQGSNPMFWHPQAVPLPPPSKEEVDEIVRLYEIVTGPRAPGSRGGHSMLTRARLGLRLYPRAHVIAALEQRYGSPLNLAHEAHLRDLSQTGPWRDHNMDDFAGLARRRAEAAARQFAVSSSGASTSVASAHFRSSSGASSSASDAHWRGSPGASSSGTSGPSSSEIDRITESASSSSDDVGKLALKLGRLR